MKPSEYRKRLAKLADEHGYEMSPTRGGHIKLTRQRDGAVVFAATSASDWRSLRNLRSQMRRPGRNRRFKP